MVTNENKIKEPWITIIAIMSVVVAVYFTSTFLKEKPVNNGIQPNFTKAQIEKIKEEENKSQQEKNKVFESYLGLKKVDIYRGGLTTPNSLTVACEDSKRVPDKCNEEIAKITKVIKTEGIINNAYLYIKAGSARGSAPLGNLTDNDSVYLYIDNAKESGGQLLRAQAKWSKINDDSIELLFDLNSVPFTHLPYDDLVTPDKVANLLDILNQPDKHFIGSFISTLGYGKIIEFKIGYEGGDIQMLSN